jgi:hypothetical protein
MKIDNFCVWSGTPNDVIPIDNEIPKQVGISGWGFALYNSLVFWILINMNMQLYLFQAPTAPWDQAPHFSVIKQL